MNVSRRKRESKSMRVQKSKSVRACVRVPEQGKGSDERKEQRETEETERDGAGRENEKTILLAES